MIHARHPWVTLSIVRLLLPVLAFLTLAVPAAAQPAAMVAAPDQVIVRYRAGTDAGERADARRDADVSREAGLPMIGGELVDPDPGTSVGAAIVQLERSPDVLYAEPDVRRTALETLPGDRFFPAQWGLRNTGQTIDGRGGSPGADIDAPTAWDVTTGSADTVVAVIDSGIDLDHPDLQPNLYRNPREVAGNAVDDDRNGFVDDITGWDFVGNDPAPDDGDGHGTHVSGTVAARGDNGAGVTGVSWRSRLLPLRVLNDTGGGTASDAIRAYGYAAAAGADVVNLSLGGPGSSRGERDAMAAAPGVLFVAAAGNERADNDGVVGSFPCNYELANVVCVAASDRSDSLASFSNFGATKVDLAAPGVDIASTHLNGGYVLLDGTSMATPHVAGAAALLLARDPAATVADLRQALLISAEPRPGLQGRVVTGGRLDLPRALTALDLGDEAAARFQQQPAAAEPAPADGSATQPAPTQSTPAPAPEPAPAPPPATAPQPLAPPDLSSPMVTVTAAPARSLATLLRRGLLSVRVRCSEACRLDLALRLDAATARRLGLPRTIARGRASRSSSGTATVRMRLSTRTRARLRRSRALRLTVATTARDTVGNRRADVLRLTLRR